MAKIHFQEGTNYRGVVFHCPGCKGAHAVPIQGSKSYHWDFSGDENSPTLSPSILVNGILEYHDPSSPRCHSFVRNGKIQFLSDCSHELAGQTVDLPEWGEECI